MNTINEKNRDKLIVNGNLDYLLKKIPKYDNLRKIKINHIFCYIFDLPPDQIFISDGKNVQFCPLLLPSEENLNLNEKIKLTNQRKFYLLIDGYEKITILYNKKKLSKCLIVENKNFLSLFRNNRINSDYRNEKIIKKLMKKYHISLIVDIYGLFI